MNMVKRLKTEATGSKFNIPRVCRRQPRVRPRRHAGSARRSQVIDRGGRGLPVLCHMGGAGCIFTANMTPMSCTTRRCNLNVVNEAVRRSGPDLFVLHFIYPSESGNRIIPG
jgi:hypothetical protein